MREMASSHDYPLGYTRKPIEEQVECLQELFPGLGSADEQIASQTLSSNAEGFVLPSQGGS